jgi:hypothetical protein
LLPDTETYSLNRNLYPDGIVRFESRNENIATVTADGTVTVHARSGSTLILVYVNERAESIYRATVAPLTESLTVTGQIPDFMFTGESFSIKVQTVPQNSREQTEITVDNPSRLSVRRQGTSGDYVFTAQSEGRVNITVRSGEASQVFTVTAENPRINVNSVELIEGQRSNPLTVLGTDRTATLRSSNPDVATVDSSGRVQAHRAGYSCIIINAGGRELFVDINVITDLERRISDLQNRFPHGLFWNNQPRSSQFPEVSEIPCDHRNNIRACIGQCAGFANLMSNETFGVNAPRYRVSDTASVRQGDYVRYSNRPGHNHSVFVIRVIHQGDIIGYDKRNGTHIRSDRLIWLVAHCNWHSDCGILWYHRYDVANHVTTFNANESYSRIS